MNKQVLTKTFSFSKWFLFFVLALGITFTGCKEDYDDDISRLDGNYTQALDKIKTLETGLNDAKDLAQKAYDKAVAAEDKAIAAENLAKETAAKLETIGDNAAKELAQKALDLAQDNEKAIEAIETANAAMQTAIDNLQTKLDDQEARLKALEQNGIPQEQFDKIVQEVIDQLGIIEPQIGELIGHRLTSLVRIPNMTLNDEPAIIFQNITYVPQVFDPLHIEYTINGVDQVGDNPNPLLPHRGEVTYDVANAKRLYLANEGTTVKYQVSPKIGVRDIDIDTPYFMGDIQTNYQDVRSVSEDHIGKDSPIKVASWTLDSSTGVLSVKVTKSVPADVNINYEGQHGSAGSNPSTSTQKYYIASLRVPIAEANRTEDEKNNGVVPEVASEYSRIAELTVEPMIKQVGTAAHHDHTVNYDRQELLNGQNIDGRYVHYHDSVSLYRSEDNVLVDHKVNWDEDVDLTKYVTVCEFERLVIDNNGNVASRTVGSHEDMDWKSYGLEFRFALASAKYYQGLNLTDQQEFAVIKNGHILNTQTYSSVPEKNRTAVGREPIVRVELRDTRNNNNLVAQRYIKFQWVDDIEVTPIEVTFPQDTVTCKMGDNQVFTQQMNVDFYNKIEHATGGLTHDEFHARYKKIEILSLTKDEVEILNVAPSWIAPTLLTKRELDDTYLAGSFPYGITVAEAEDYAKVNNLGGNNHEDQNAEDVILAFCRDQNQSNMTYNLKWFMSQHAVGPIDKVKKKSDYVMKVKFVDQLGSSDLEVTFKQTIIIPSQIFNHVGTFWMGEDAKGGYGVFKVNPIVYDTPSDGAAPLPIPAAGVPNPPMTATSWTNPLYTGSDYSHIQADLVNGWRYRKGTSSEAWTKGSSEWVNGTDVRPANLAEFIRYIRSCAEVKFVFDESRFAQYSGQIDSDGLQKANLSTYETEGMGAYNGVVLRKKGSLVLPNMTQTYYNGQTVTQAGGQDETPRDNYDYIQHDDIAATISNVFGASRDENNGNSSMFGTDQNNYLNWQKEEELGMGDYGNPTKPGGVANGVVRLHETNNLNGTPSAREMIGKKVPVNLEVTYNMYNVIPEQVFEVFFIDPLKVNNQIEGQFIDATVNGSYIDAQKGLSFTDWQGYEVGRYEPAVGEANEKKQYPWDLWVYYAVSDVKFDVNNISSSLRWQGSNLIHDPNVNNGPVPSDVSIKQVQAPLDANGDPIKSQHVVVSSNPTHLAYFNDSGTPVNATYFLYVPIEVTYKWGVMTSGDKPLRVPVQPSTGVTP